MKSTSQNKKTGIMCYLGIALMVLGVAMMVAVHLFGLTFVNLLLLVPLCLILLGLAIHVWGQRKIG